MTDTPSDLTGVGFLSTLKNIWEFVKSDSRGTGAAIALIYAFSVFPNIIHFIILAVIIWLLAVLRSNAQREGAESKS